MVHGAGAAAIVGAAPVLPAVGAAVFTAAAGWWLGTKLGVFTQAAKTEAGLDLIERRMMTDEEGNHLSNLSIGLGSMAVGAVNGALELFEWEVAGRPFTSVARRAMEKEALAAVSSAVTRRLAKLPAAAKIAGLAAKDWGMNVFTESMTEVMQDLVPITIDEMQKHYLLSDFDRRTLGEISAQLTDTFTSSVYSFALISALGPARSFAGSITNRNGYYRMELARRELEAMETARLNRSLASFGEMALATKLFKRLPGMSEAHSAEALAHSDLSRAYVPASTVEKLFQEAKKDPGNITKASDYASAKEWAEDVFGVSAADYDESMETGHRMEIAAARVFEAAGENDAVMEELRRNMSWTADGMTAAEAEETQKNIDELLREDFLKFRASSEFEQQEERSARVIYESTRMQLEQAGHDAETASNWAWMKARMYIPLARMYSDAMPAKAQKAAQKAGRTLGRFMPEDIERMFPMVIETGEDGRPTGLRFTPEAEATLSQAFLNNIEARYEKAVAAGDLERAGALVEEYARTLGYSPESAEQQNAEGGSALSAVVRDDAGNVVPLSQRFNAARPEVFLQPMNAFAGASHMVEVADLRRIKVPKSIKTRNDLKKYLLDKLQNLPKMQFSAATADGEAIINVLHNKAGHIAFSPAPKTKQNIKAKAHIAVKNKSVISLKDLIERAVLIENEPNTKIKPIKKGMSKGQCIFS